MKANRDWRMNGLYHNAFWLWSYYKGGGVAEFLSVFEFGSVSCIFSLFFFACFFDATISQKTYNSMGRGVSWNIRMATKRHPQNTWQ